MPITSTGLIRSHTSASPAATRDVRTAPKIMHAMVNGTKPGSNRLSCAIEIPIVIITAGHPNRRLGVMVWQKHSHHLAPQLA
jgi:hypothetical protein